MTEHSIYEIGSITKTFTATLLADEVLKGEMKLDDPAKSIYRIQFICRCMKINPLPWEICQIILHRCQGCLIISILHTR